MYNNIPTPSRVACRYSYHLMRGTRRPIWEDTENVNGGYWKLKVPKIHTVSRLKRTSLRNMIQATVWKELVLACIGEQFVEATAAEDDVTGISVSVREREDVIQVWNSNSTKSNEASVIPKIKSLVPHVQFITHFYKGKNHKTRLGDNVYFSPQTTLCLRRFAWRQILSSRQSPSLERFCTVLFCYCRSSCSLIGFSSSASHSFIFLCAILCSMSVENTP